MKLLVSDYDDTFHINDSDISKNIKLVKQFMENHLFVIATGRSYPSFVIEKKSVFNRLSLFDYEPWCDYYKER